MMPTEDLIEESVLEVFPEPADRIAITERILKKIILQNPILLGDAGICKSVRLALKNYIEKKDGLR